MENENIFIHINKRVLRGNHTYSKHCEEIMICEEVFSDWENQREVVLGMLEKAILKATQVSKEELEELIKAGVIDDI